MTMESTLSCCSRLGTFFSGGREPSKKEGIGAQARKHAKHSVRGRRPFFVIHDKMQVLAIRKGAGAALDRFRVAVQRSRTPNRQLKRYSSSPVLNLVIAKARLRSPGEPRSSD